MVAVPGETPTTSPDAVTVATAVLVLLHVPPVAVLVSDMVSAWHTESAPLMAPASAIGLTVAITVVVTDPQVLLSV